MQTIEALKKIQKRDKLTDNKVAEKIGMHAISYNRIKKHRSNPDIETYSKIVRAFPETASAILEDIFGADYLTFIKPVLFQIIDDMKSKDVPNG